VIRYSGIRTMWEPISFFRTNGVRDSVALPVERMLHAPKLPHGEVRFPEVA
jgi:hypothetical protein